MDDYTGNCRAVVEAFVETFVETIIRLPSILVLRVSRALELHIGLQAELQGVDPLGPPYALRAPFAAWPVHWMGRGVVKPLVELL
jgi:hypothetical protein